MQIEDIISTLSELSARIARLAKKIDDIYNLLAGKEG